MGISYCCKANTVLKERPDGSVYCECAKCWELCEVYVDLREWEDDNKKNEKELRIKKSKIRDMHMSVYWQEFWKDLINNKKTKEPITFLNHLVEIAISFPDKQASKWNDLICDINNIIINFMEYDQFVDYGLYLFLKKNRDCKINGNNIENIKSFGLIKECIKNSSKENKKKLEISIYQDLPRLNDATEYALAKHEKMYYRVLSAASRSSRSSVRDIFYSLMEWWAGYFWDDKIENLRYGISLIKDNKIEF